MILRAKAERAKAKVIPTARAATEPIQDVHPAIQGTARTLRKSKSDTHGAIRAVGDGLLWSGCRRRQCERVIASLDGLARKPEAEGLQLKPTGQAMRVSVEGDSATFTIKEQTRCEKHIPTPEEASPISDFGRMVDWARQRLAALEAAADPKSVNRDLGRKGLFPVVDELHDPEGDPPDEPYSW